MSPPLGSDRDSWLDRVPWLDRVSWLNRRALHRFGKKCPVLLRTPARFRKNRCLMHRGVLLLKLPFLRPKLATCTQQLVAVSSLPPRAEPCVASEFSRLEDSSVGSVPPRLGTSVACELLRLVKDIVRTSRTKNLRKCEGLRCGCALYNRIVSPCGQVPSVLVAKERFGHVGGERASEPGRVFALVRHWARPAGRQMGDHCDSATPWEASQCLVWVPGARKMTLGGPRSRILLREGGENNLHNLRGLPGFMQSVFAALPGTAPNRACTAHGAAQKIPI